MMGKTRQNTKNKQTFDFTNVAPLPFVGILERKLQLYAISKNVAMEFF